MFYVFDIYNSVAMLHTNSLYASNKIERQVINNKVFKLNLQRLQNITVGVIDTSDMVEEHYSIYELLDIIAKTKVEIGGVRIKFVDRYLSPSPNNLDTVSSLEIYKSVKDTSRGFFSSMAKLKLVYGIDISLNGELNSIKDSIVSGNKLKIPEGVLSLGYGIIKNGYNLSNIEVLELPSTFNLSDYKSLSVLDYITRNMSRKNKLIIVNDDISITRSLFSKFKCSVHSNKTISVNLKSLNNYLIDKERASKLRGLKSKFTDSNIFTFSDSTKSYVMDLNNYSISMRL